MRAHTKQLRFWYAHTLQSFHALGRSSLCDRPPKRPPAARRSLNFTSLPRCMHRMYCGQRHHGTSELSTSENIRRYLGSPECATDRNAGCFGEGLIPTFSGNPLRCFLPPAAHKCTPERTTLASQAESYVDYVYFLGFPIIEKALPASNILSTSYGTNNDSRPLALKNRVQIGKTTCTM